jgi:hypothetical protein
MTAAKRAAIDQDVLDRPLGEISAVQLLDVLQQAKLSSEVMAILPDKKKYELWIDEGGVAKIPVGVIIERLKREKKKLELEKRFVIENFPKRYREFEIDPGTFIDPVIREELVQEVVTEVMKRVGR